MREPMPSASHDPLTAPRESSWADVEIAQDIARRRLTPRWWSSLAWGLLMACLVALLVSSSDRAWLYFALIVAAFCANSWEQSLRGVEARISALPSAQLTTCVVLFTALVVGGFWLVIALNDLSPFTSIAVGLLCGGLMWTSQLVLELLLARSTGTAGDRLAQSGKASGRTPELDDPLALRAAAVLHCVGSMSESTLAQDLGLRRAEAERLLDQMAGRLLVSRRQHWSDPADRLWASLTPAGHRCLAAHLAAISTTTGGEE